MSTGLLEMVAVALVSVVGFLMLASPTVRREVIEYFDLYSKYRKKLAKKDDTNS